MTTDQREELEMDSNREAMLKINKLFNVTFYLCMYTPVGKTFIVLAVIVATMLSGGLTFGNSDFRYMLTADWIDVITIIVMSIAFIGSSLRKKAFTAASAAVLIIHGILILNSGHFIPFDAVTMVITVIQTCLQIACLKNYGKLEQLKQQPGYPDFNGIFFADRLRTRITTDEQVRTAIEMGGLTEMDAAKADGSTLTDKTAEAPQTEYVMEDIAGVETGIDESEYKDIRHDMDIFNI